MKRHLPVLLLLACAAIFAGTFYLLLKNRFEAGDVYPPSSSLRSDPLGTMILFESLQALPGVSVERDHNAVNRLPEGRGTTYLHFAARSEDWTLMPPELYRTIDQFLLQGGRLVLTFTPEFAGAERSGEKKEDEKKPADSEKKNAKKEEDPPKKKDRDETYMSLKQEWGLDLDREHIGAREHPVRKTSPLPLPEELKWHGDIFLKDPDASWQVLYRSDKGAVVAERKRGPGSIVVATDSYFVSNEALVRDRQPEMLAWLVGANNRIVFDEAHFGIMETPGIAALARKYRLHGGVAALLVLAGLFLWKNSSSLAPPRAPAEFSPDVIPGRNAAAGFVGLLRRNIPGDRILEICLEEWRKAFAHGARVTPREKAAVEEIARAEAVRPPRERDPVAAAQKIHAALHRGPVKPHA
jgi:hypothetical protein